MAYSDELCEEFASRLVAMSPSAQDMAEGEKYRLYIPDDEISPNSILDTLFMCLLNDLQTLGVGLSVPANDFFGNSITLDRFLIVFEKLMPTKLMQTMRTDVGVYTAIKDIIDGNITDEPAYTSVIDWIAEQDPDLSEVCEEIVQGTVSTEIFKTYLENMLARAEETTVSEFNVVNDPKAWVALVARLDDELEDCYTKAKLLDGIDTEKLLKRFKMFIAFLNDSHNIAEKQWIFTTPRSSLAENMIAIYDKKRREFLTDTRLSPQYFIARSLEITLTDVVGFVSFVHALMGGSEDRDVICRHFVKLCPGAQDIVPKFTRLLTGDTDAV